ncbi:DUF4469 domain-containing protein [Chryseobacterium taichungense]|uniref:DUF4469 domain-containing protein n=1 Tax=Chryseobacterium taichungense TaxID=295069 RepID=UPI0035E3FFEA
MGGADISASSMEHATELFLKEMAYQLCDGFSVNTGYFTASTTIRGVFDSPSETFNKDKHSIIFQFNQGEKLRAEIPNIEVNILGVAESSAVILQVTDVKSGSVNDLLTPGRNLKIVGSKIKVAGEDSSVGIYFVDVATQERTKVEPSDIVTNNPSELILVIPALAAGTYNLEVVTQYGGGTPLKDARTATLDKILTVA